MEEKRKNKGNVPNLRFPGFEREWKTASIGECSSSLEYGMNSSATKFDGENKYIRITDIDDGSRKYKSHSPVSPEGILSEKYLVKENDILFVRTGADTGRSYCYDSNDGKLYFAGFLIRARINPIYNGNFIFAQTLTQKYNRWVKLMSMRSGQPGINSQEYSSFQFNIPTKEEQDKISLFLSKIDARIETQSKIIENYKSQIKGISDKVFSRELRLKDDEGNKFPEWCYLKGNEVFDNISNKKHNSDLPILAITQEYGAIPRNMIDFQISVTNKSIESYKVVEKGDFIISLRSFQGGIEYSNYTGICSPAYIILKAKLKIDSSFYRYYLRTEKYIRSLNEKLEGIRDGKMISYKYFSDIPLPYPSFDEQCKIVSILSSLEKRIEIEKQLLIVFQNQKKYFLKSLLI